jgi:hypothetical protein
LRIDPKDLRRHYASLSDEELLDLDRADLVEMARKIYDEEIARRGLDRPQEEETPYEPAEVEHASGESDGGDFGIDDGPPPDWLEDAAYAYSTVMSSGVDYVSDAAEVRAALRAAGIPNYITVKPADPEPPRAEPPSLYCVMVPGALNLHATSVVEREIFNPQSEADWRNHLEALSDEELRVLKPEVFCGALLDKAERLKRAYRDEIARRKLK